MKGIIKAFFVALLFVTSVVGSFAQSNSTLGKQFWVTFLENIDEGYSLELKLIITGSRSCSGNINNPNTGWNMPFTVTQGLVTEIVIPQAQAYTINSESVTNTGLFVTATDTVSVYSSNLTSASFDITNVLPQPTLMEEYMIQTYPVTVRSCVFAIIADENNTVVDITPTNSTENGRPANTTFSVTLNRGQCYQVASNLGDFSGTRIVARDCKKIAVLSGNICVNVRSSNCCCDHIVEQSIPVAYWGKKFVLTTSSMRSNDIIRVTALNDNCRITKNGSLLTTINAGATYEFEMQSSEASAFLETSEPASVFLYFTGYDYGGTNGDPSMVVINPIEQKINEITFGTFTVDVTQYHFVNIVTETADVAGMTLDGSNIATQFSPVSGNPVYSYAKIALTYGSHTLRNSQGGFIAHVYGLGNCESYSYSVGASAINLNRQVLINDIPISALLNGANECQFNPITFEAEVDYDYTAIHWDFGDGETGDGQTVVHQYPIPGTYIVTVIIERVTTNCFNDLFDTITAPVHIAPIDPIVTNVTICPGESYLFNGLTVTQPGTYRDTIDLSGMCDSILELNLTYAPRPSVSLGNDISICYDYQFPVILNAGTGFDTYLWSNGATTPSISVSQPGIYSVIVANSNGCEANDDIEVTLNTDIDISIENQTEDFCENHQAILVAQTNAPSILWSTGETTPQITALFAGTYYVTAQDGDCKGVASILIERCPFNIYLPNAITPTDCNGINDYFALPEGTKVGEFEIFIYNRWGMLVYHSEDPHFKWDGSVNGKIFQNQTYTYVIFAEPVDIHKKEKYHGIVTVL